MAPSTATGRHLRMSGSRRRMRDRGRRRPASVAGSRARSNAGLGGRPIGAWAATRPGGSAALGSVRRRAVGCDRGRGGRPSAAAAARRGRRASRRRVRERPVRRGAPALRRRRGVVGAWSLGSRRGSVRGSRGGSAARAREHGELELESQPADPGPVRVDGGETAAGGGERGGSWRAAPGRETGDRARPGSPRPPGRAAPGCRGRVPRARRAGATPAAPSPRTRWSMKASTTSASARPEQVADVRSSIRSRRGRQELVEHRFGVAHPAGGEPGDEVDGGRLGFAAVGGEDAGELALDLGDRQAPDVEALEARQDRRREAATARSRRT